MKPIHSILVLSILALTSACSTQGAYGGNHWSQRSISNSIGRTSLGYVESRDGAYSNFYEAESMEFGVTFRRYFFHHNPENPFQAYDATYYEKSGTKPTSASYLRSSVGVGADVDHSYSR